MDYNVSDFHIHTLNTRVRKLHAVANHVIFFKKRYGINKIALMSLEHNAFEQNKKIQQICDEDKDIFGLYWIQGSRIVDDYNYLREHGGKWLGVKFHGSFEQRRVTANRYSSIMKYLNEFGKVLLVHCGRYNNGDPSSITSFRHAVEIADRFRDIKVVMAHMGGNDNMITKQVCEEVACRENLFVDTSGISTPYRIELMVDRTGSDKILFGSDFPWCSFRGCYYNVYDAHITDGDRRKIFNENFEKMIQVCM